MDTRRNVVLIMCDQLRADFLRAYGAAFIPTPHIDALAAEGVVFDNAITASTVCAPARMSFLTGRPVSGHGAWTNEIPAREGVEFLPERLTAAGYMTAAVGCYDHAPNEEPLGYRYRRLEMGNMHNHPTVNEGAREFHRRHPDETNVYAADESGHYRYPEEEFYDRWSTDRAVEFIECYTKTGKAPDGTLPPKADAPFFLYCGLFSPHAPLVPPREVAGRVDPEGLPPIRYQNRPFDQLPAVERYRSAFLNTPEALVDPKSAEEERQRGRLLYAELITEVDDLVGRIVQALKQNGRYENTTILFTSDHGSCEYDFALSSKGPYPYKAQLFIPMILSNHPDLAAGTRCDALCGGLDIGATVLGIAGDERAFGISRSMISLATGKMPEREVNFSEFCDSSKTVVDKRYTFIYYPFTGKSSLFDRVADPYETTDLSGRAEYAEIERRFLMHTVDFMILAKGVRIETHDLNPEVQEGLAKKHPRFLDDFEICYPIASREAQRRLEAAGLSVDYNEFCKTREIRAHYGVYFLE